MQDDPSNSDDVKRAREAAAIVRQLDENPEDPSAIADRDAFLSRGSEERETYARMTRALNAAQRGMKPKPLGPVALILCVIAAATYFAYAPLKVEITADLITRLEPKERVLKSGDGAYLAASSALIDLSDKEDRRVTLLRGAAFFDVDQDGRRFIVQAGPIRAEAIGTSFEVAVLDDLYIVGVTEGVVDARIGSEIFRLTTGDRMRWSEADGPMVETLTTARIAEWRRDEISIDGLTFAQVAAAIGRRVPGTVLVWDGGLAATRVSGRLDLTRPVDALRTLAATSGASVTSAPPIATVIYPD